MIEVPAGATPVVDGATPSQSTPAQPAAAPAAAEPATGDAAALGDPGKKALDAERARAKAAEKERDALAKRLEDLEAASKTDTEKAIDAARKEGIAEATSKWQSQVRRSEIRAALTSAGINPGVLDVAEKADEFAQLAVSDEGELEGLPSAVEAFKKARPVLFGTAQGPGSFDTGTGGGRPGAARIYSRRDLRDPEFFAKNRDDIMVAAREGRVTD